MRRILLVKLRSMGDVVLGARAFSAIRKAYPKAWISALVQPPAHEILKFSGWVDEVFAYSKSALDRQGLWVRTAKEAKLVDAIRSRKFGLSVDFYGSHRSARLVKNSGATVQIGLDLPETAGFYDLRVNVEDRLSVSAVELDARLTRVLGVEPKGEVLWPVPPTAREYAERFFEFQGWDGSTPIVAVNPFASCPSKEWEDAKWAGVIRALEPRGVKVFVTCAPMEVPRLRGIETALGRKIPAYAGASLAPLLGLYRKSSAVLSVDSGPKHLAAAVGTSTVTVWGPERPSRWHPYDLAKHPLVLREIDCRPCGLSVCVTRKHECLRSLEPSDVLKALGTVMKER